MGSKWAELPEKITNGLGWVGRKVVENNICPMEMGWAGLKPAQPAHCPTLIFMLKSEILRRLRIRVQIWIFGNLGGFCATFLEIWDPEL